MSEVGADSRLNSSLTLRVAMAAARVFRKVTIKALLRALAPARLAGTPRLAKAITVPPDDGNDITGI